MADRSPVSRARPVIGRQNLRLTRFRQRCVSTGALNVKQGVTTLVGHQLGTIEGGIGQRIFEEWNENLHDWLQADNDGASKARQPVFRCPPMWNLLQKEWK